MRISDIDRLVGESIGDLVVLPVNVTDSPGDALGAKPQTQLGRRKKQITQANRSTRILAMSKMPSLPCGIHRIDLGHDGAAPKT